MATASVPFRADALASSLASATATASDAPASALDAALESLTHDMGTLPATAGGSTRGRSKKTATSSESAPPAWAKTTDSVTSVLGLLLLAGADSSLPRSSTGKGALLAMSTLSSWITGSALGSVSDMLCR